MFIIRHCSTDELIKANVNRLTPFYPWSKETPSTSPTSTTQDVFKQGGPVEIGSLIIVEFDQVQLDNSPIALGRVTSRDPHTRALTFRWLWNYNGSMLAPMHEGWYDNTDGRWQWSPPTGRNKTNFIPYTNEGDEGLGLITDTDVLIHGFDLVKRKLPPAVLRFLSDNPKVPWSLP